MAKSQKRNTREAKKPKKDKSTAVAVETVSSLMSKGMKTATSMPKK